MPQFEAHFEHLQPAKHGIIVSSILLTASVFSLVAGPLADRISRTRTIALGALVFAAGEAMCLCAQKGQLCVFIAGRCIAGAGEGLFLSTITTYTLEIAPTHMRGRLSVTVQLFLTLGIALGYFTCFGSVKLEGDDWAWRVPFLIQVVLASILACGALLLPHSPRWLRHVGRTREAQASWTRLGISLAEAEKEQEADARDEQRQAQTRNSGLKETWFSLWRKDVRARTVLGVFLMGLMNASGVDAVLYVRRFTGSHQTPLKGVLLANLRFSSLTGTVRAAFVRTGGLVQYDSFLSRFRSDWPRECGGHDSNADVQRQM